MSRFVAAGADGEPTEQDAKWLAAQQAIEATRSRPKVEVGSQEGGKSLYETLQANKAAKQEAFEQSIRLGNQFQNLNDDDVDFLDSVLESTRAHEAALKRETQKEVDAFRRQQQEQQQLETERLAAQSVGPAAAIADSIAEQTTWKVGRKRKKDQKETFGGIKIRKSSSSSAAAAAVVSAVTAEKALVPEQSAEPETAKRAAVSPTEKLQGSMDSKPTAGVAVEPGQDRTAATTAGTAPAAGLALVAYSSDEDD